MREFKVFVSGDVIYMGSFRIEEHRSANYWGIFGGKNDSTSVIHWEYSLGNALRWCSENEGVK